jgi:hypothetical protein
MSLGTSKCQYSNNCLQFLKCSVPLTLYQSNLDNSSLTPRKTKLWEMLGAVDLLIELAGIVKKVNNIFNIKRS